MKDQNRRDMSTNSKTDFFQDCTVQSIAVRVQSIVTEAFFKKFHYAINYSNGAIDCTEGFLKILH